MSSTSAPAGRTALVFGASGITGWAIVREALQYPSPTAFSRVIGLTNRPMDPSQFLLPDDSRIHFASGIDLTGAVNKVVDELSGVPGIEDVTDVYFAGENLPNSPWKGANDSRLNPLPYL